MPLDISNNSAQNYTINTAGVHVFYLRNTDADITFDIAAQNAQVYVFGIYDIAPSDKYKLRIITHHRAPSSQSHVLIKSVLRNQSQFDFSGTIRVDATASETTATLDNSNLIIGTDTIITTIPQLEIVPANVSCRHSATTTRVNPDQLTYLASRNINQKTATKLLVSGFINDIENQIAQIEKSDNLSNEQ